MGNAEEFLKRLLQCSEYERGQIHKSEQKKIDLIQDESMQKPCPAAFTSKYESLYKRNASRKLKYKMETAMLYNIFEIRPRKFCKILTKFDIDGYKKIVPMELVIYDGTDETKERCINLEILKIQNRSLTAFVSCNLQENSMFSYFYKLAIHLKKIGNLNSFTSVVNGLKSGKLKQKQLAKLRKLMKSGKIYASYNEICQSRMKEKEFLIPLIDDILRDVRVSNLNKKNFMASYNFCKTLDIFVYTQNQNFDFKIRKRDEHCILKALENLSLGSKNTIQVIEKEEKLGYFLMWL